MSFVIKALRIRTLNRCLFLAFHELLRAPLAFQTPFPNRGSTSTPHVNILCGRLAVKLFRIARRDVSSLVLLLVVIHSGNKFGGPDMNFDGESV